MPRPLRVVATFCAAIALAAWVRGANGQVRARGHAWLGISMAQGSEHGVPVAHVVRGSPADQAGIRAGDVLVRLARENVTRANDIVLAVAGSGVGATIDVVFTHAGTEHKARVILAAMPSADEIMRMDLVGSFAPPLRGAHPVSGAFPESIAALRGRVVLLDFWATWCGPCRVVIPKLSALQNRYGAQGLTVLGVAADDSEDVVAFASTTAVSYSLAADALGETSATYGVSSLPTLLLIDKRGVIRELAVGYGPGEDAWLEAQVRTLLSEPGPG